MKKPSLSLIVLIWSFQSLAWGPIGHRSTGEIAEAHLSPKAKAAVQRILGKQSLADVANWADVVRAGNTYQQTSWYHFEKIADGKSYLENLKSLRPEQQKKGGPVQAILVAEENLRKENTPATHQADTLKFLVHFVGDIHQPLHTGKPEDNGGNKVDVTWFGQPMNLHRVWDSGLIETGHQDLFRRKESDPEDSVVYSRYLIEKFQGVPVSVEPNVEAWLNESLALRVGAYDPRYQSDQETYLKDHLPEVDLRIYSAGLRLAALLNSIYEQEPMPSTEKELWKDIESLVGSLYRLISFSP